MTVKWQWGDRVVNKHGHEAVVRGWRRDGVELWLEFPTSTAPQREIAADWKHELDGKYRVIYTGPDRQPAHVDLELDPIVVDALDVGPDAALANAITEALEHDNWGVNGGSWSHALGAIRSRMNPNPSPAEGTPTA